MYENLRLVILVSRGWSVEKLMKDKKECEIANILLRGMKLQSQFQPACYVTAILDCSDGKPGWWLQTRMNPINSGATLLLLVRPRWGLEWGAYLHPVRGWLGWGIGRRQAGVSCTSFHCGWSGQGGGLERAGAMSVGGGSSSLSSCLGLASLGSRWGCWFLTWVGGSGGSGGGSTRMGVKAAGWFDPVPCRLRGARWVVFEMGVF